ncbi:hypothetical protein [uncultured Croceitalea sp.]|uniref:hypothetical protein n=1 Tax=uncultured Croceitalea sp. TaxID=1798908 RepID=UPI003305B9FC
MDLDAKKELYSKTIALAGLELKGKNMLYTSSNGYMFSQLNKVGEIGIRLSKSDIADFDAQFGAHPFKSYGATMREYVLIPENIHNDLQVLSEWLKKGYQYVCSLPPK